jgi:hypothetical protein
LTRIALNGRERLYNVASGQNVTNAEIARWLVQVGVETRFAPGVSTVTFPHIDTRRIEAEFGPMAMHAKLRLEAVIRDELGAVL